MKKSVVILIAIIYVASVALVNFFGLKDKQYAIEVDAQELVLLNTDTKVNSQGMKWAEAKDEDGDGDWEYQLQWQVLPENATDKTVTITNTSAKKDVEIDEETGLITFKSRGVATFKIEAVGSSGLSLELMIKTA